jgi:hypothetical protein
MALGVALFPMALAAQSDVSLEIRFANGVSSFHVGEVIPIELSFTSSTDDTYSLNTATQDRSGRINIDTFHVSPQGRDPLAKYYSMGMMGGGLSGIATLSAKPRTILRDLNEWVAVDRPGHYSLVVTSQRISKATNGIGKTLDLRSNSLEFDIVPADAAWQRQTLGAAVAVLDTVSSKDTDKREALHGLRFLDTPGSIHELVRRLGKPGESCWDCVAGLAGSKTQELAVRELEQQFGAGDIALSQEYISILSRLKSQLKQAELGPYPRDDVKAQQAWQLRLRQQGEETAALEDKLYRQAAAVVGAKSGAARAQTVKALLMRPTRGAADLAAAIPEGDVASAFAALPEMDQYFTLMSFWDRMRVSAMVGPLEDLARTPRLQNPAVRELAMQRLFDLDPDAAKPIVLEEMRHPHTSPNGQTVKGAALSMLPEKELPEFDELLMGRLEQPESRTRGLDAQLLGRYATKAVLMRAKTSYAAPGSLQDCETQDGFVAYFLRVDADFGVARLAASPSFCMGVSLPLVVRMKRWKDVEPAVIAAMYQPDLNRARQAAETLAKYGGPKAEEAMWARMKQFHDEWAPRESEFSPSLKQATDVREASSFQYGVVESLGHALGWLLSNEQIDALETLTLGQERENVKLIHWTTPVDVTYTVVPDGRTDVMLGRLYKPMSAEQVFAKMKQYPAGTKFVVRLLGDEAKLADVRQGMVETASEAGLTLEFTGQP